MKRRERIQDEGEERNDEKGKKTRRGERKKKRR
jgi:hypothetical protein